ncbi:hypothetical protein PSU4_17210 [Pseudonocardia sulfidoxydans NBRC 16205]|uniref:Uncharacterized protein n=1 Tax=Pseudonocardia sulfidoxydans NBRC 16205 TaxID=1223511 RepID=A0A511DE05_9PSEU|nr:hypothetical protein PSU4_17210 [Pseudonocardia sulfidoxydans NBRC 16205]
MTGMVERAAAAARAEGAGAAEGERSEPLGNITHSASVAGEWFALRDRKPGKVDRSDPAQRQAARDTARGERWDLRRAMRGFTESRRVRSCGRAGAREDGSVVLRVTDATGTAAESSTGATGSVAGFGGLFHCGNVWLCPECSTKIAAARAAELESVLAHHIAAGGWAILVTVTMRHHRGHGLDQCLTAAGRGWRAVVSGRRWQDDKAASGFAGYARALEITESPENGWHVHFHAVIVFSARPSDDMVEHVVEGMFSRWSAGLVKAGMPAPSREHGLDVQHLDPDAGAGRSFGSVRAWAKYVTKGIAAEATLGVTKSARGGNRTARELMRDALAPQRWENPANGQHVLTVDQTARVRLREYERAVKGRKMLTWSTGRHDLREAAGLGEERTDDEIAADDLDGEDVAVITRDGWRAVKARATELLSVTETAGPDAARRWLTERGVDWYAPTRLTDQHRRHVETG